MQEWLQACMTHERPPLVLTLAHEQSQAHKPSTHEVTARNSKNAPIWLAGLATVTCCFAQRTHLCMFCACIGMLQCAYLPQLHVLSIHCLLCLVSLQTSHNDVDTVLAGVWLRYSHRLGITASPPRAVSPQRYDCFYAVFVIRIWARCGARNRRGSDRVQGQMLRRGSVWTGRVRVLNSLQHAWMNLNKSIPFWSLVCIARMLRTFAPADRIREVNPQTRCFPSV